MVSQGTIWAKGTLIAAALGALAAGCAHDDAKGAENGAAECAAVRRLGAGALDRWNKQNEDAPAPDAPLGAAADHAAALAKTARAIGADFAKAAPKQRDLAESAEGARMLGDLAGQKLDVLAGTVRELTTRLEPLTKLETTANDAVEALGKDVAASVGCDKKGPPACAAVQAQLTELEHARAPAGFTEAARAARGRADTLDALAKAVEALPAAPPKQKARDEATKHAREGATGFRALAKALDDAAPYQERLGKERQDAEEAVIRLSAELEAASKLCLPPAAPSGSASAPPPASAGAAPKAPPAGSAAPK